ncbi:MAG: aminopeptidase P family protein, partial [Verrucomicrobia bacterium]|nr:aminopeptidase P family protein [Verrucomicrobiota bacterium]
MMSTKRLPRLIFASSDASADMFYATKIFIPDPFLFLEQNGKKTLILSNLEVDRGRKEAKVDEVVAYSDIEEPLEAKLKSRPTLEQTIGSFLRQRRVKQAL